MNEKEVGELRRRLRTDKCAVNCFYGCLVNEKREIETSFKLSAGLMPKDDVDFLLKIMKKGLSGTLGKNLIDLSFSNQQVLDSDEHRMLMSIKNDSEETEAAIQTFFEKTAENTYIDGRYLILLLKDVYDVPSYSKNGEIQDESTNVFRYFLCVLCPLKDSKESLTYRMADNTFKSVCSSAVVCSPELGFMFPAFDDRTANIYDVIYYTKNTSVSRAELLENVFHISEPMPADTQKEIFNSILTQSLEENCNLNVAVAVRDTICEQIQSHRDNNEEEPLVITKHSVRRILDECNVPQENSEAFEAKYDETFGEKAELSPGNIIDTKAINVNTPDVCIKINSERSDLLQTKMIDGVRYILIRAETDVEVNGVNINF